MITRTQFPRVGRLRANRMYLKISVKWPAPQVPELARVHYEIGIQTRPRRTKSTPGFVSKLSPGPFFFHFCEKEYNPHCNNCAARTSFSSRPCPFLIVHCTDIASIQTRCRPCGYQTPRVSPPVFSTTPPWPRVLAQTARCYGPYEKPPS